MHIYVRAAIVVILLIVPPAFVFADQQVEIFNGKDLEGWTKRGGNGTYDVENGEIVGRSAPNTTNTFLCTNKEFSDFELELDFKIDPKDVPVRDPRDVPPPDISPKPIKPLPTKPDPKPRPTP